MLRTIFLLIIFFTISTNAFASLIITEVFPNPSGKDKNKEWIELYNSSSSELSLEGWKINETELSHSNIKPNSFKTFNIPLSNKEQELVLISPEGKISSHLSYTESKENLSYSNCRIKKDNLQKNTWLWTLSSKNQANPELIEHKGVITSEIEIKEEYQFYLDNKKIIINDKLHSINNLQNLFKKDQQLSVLLNQNILQAYKLKNNNDVILEETKTNWINLLLIPISILGTILFFIPVPIKDP